MFRPNQGCVIFKASGKTDVYGMPLAGTRQAERCSIITLNVKNEKSAVRADTSASRGNARELEVDAKLLLTKTTVAAIDDVIEVAGTRLRIMSRFPRHDLQGRLDHFEVTCTYWSN
jgi:hypothetical protein